MIDATAPTFQDAPKTFYSVRMYRPVDIILDGMSDGPVQDLAQFTTRGPLYHLCKRKVQEFWLSTKNSEEPVSIMESLDPYKLANTSESTFTGGRSQPI